MRYGARASEKVSRYRFNSIVVPLAASSHFAQLMLTREGSEYSFPVSTNGRWSRMRVVW